MRTEKTEKQDNHQKNIITLKNIDLYSLAYSQPVTSLRSNDGSKLSAIKNKAKLTLSRFFIEIFDSKPYKAMMAVIEAEKAAISKEWKEKMIEARGEDGFKKINPEEAGRLYNSYFNSQANRIIDCIDMEDTALTITKTIIKEEDLDVNQLSVPELEFILKYFDVQEKAAG